jgi:hypothetical protein
MEECDQQESHRSIGQFVCVIPIFTRIAGLYRLMLDCCVRETYSSSVTHTQYHSTPFPLLHQLASADASIEPD